MRLLASISNRIRQAIVQSLNATVLVVTVCSTNKTSPSLGVVDGDEAAVVAE